MKPKDRVYIPRLRDEGVIESEGRGGLLRILVDGIYVELPAWEVQPMTAEIRKHLKKRTKVKQKVSVTPVSKAAVAAREIDLHGLTVEEALSVLSEKINQAILLGADRLAVVHGIGTGRVKQAVHKYLAQLPAVEKFQEDPGNSGMTWVYF